MATVKKLTPEVINLIAAGEVVVGPWSVLKELLDNSIDAGASRIEVSLEAGGLKEIKVDDDGIGMSPKDIALAVERYTTSKISSADDLYNIKSLGFRGEALSAIAAVSRTTIRCRRSDDEVGTMVYVEGGKVHPAKETAAAAGTSVAVKDLFFNVPARRKFLSSKGVEARRAGDYFKKAALAHLKPALKLSLDGRLLYVCSEESSIRERVGEVLGWEVLPKLITFEGEAEGLTLKGYMSKPGAVFPAGRVITMMNRRPIKGGPIYRGIMSAYQGRLEKDTYPLVVLYLDIAPDAVDVNVHPTKEEVKFADYNLVYRTVFNALRHALDKVQTTVSVGDIPAAGGRSGQLRVTAEIENRVMGYLAEQGLIEWEESVEPGSDDGGRALPSEGILERKAQTVVTRRMEEGRDFEEIRVAVEGEEEGLTIMGQLENKYILLARGPGLLVIDQHTAHERVIYDKLIAQDEVSRQNLLIPEVVEVEGGDNDLLDELLPGLNELGFDIMPFGGNTFIIKSHPADFKVSQIGGFIREVIEDYAERGGKPKSKDRRHRLFASIACRASVMAGDNMTAEEMAQLVRDLFACETPNLCPHGRPTMV
ncbi:MAG: DNA mismatch repair endonuclease MutL, partial [bacterium]|nr:DNA mismatch repair endonuclease MutL [bacterium]